MNQKDILQHWEAMAERYNAEYLATIPDKYLKDIELDSIFPYLSNHIKMLEVGCGNGFSCFRIRERFDLDLKGIDYSRNMIKAATARLAELGYNGLVFVFGDATQLEEPDGFYDVVLTERCLINLSDWEQQQLAITQINRALKQGGLYIMSEAFMEPLNHLNELRRRLKLPAIETKWHNRYLVEKETLPFVETLFRTKAFLSYSSLYYLLTRVVSPKMGEIEQRETGYLDSINQVAAMLPPIGDFGPQKTLVLEKL